LDGNNMSAPSSLTIMLGLSSNLAHPRAPLVVVVVALALFVTLPAVTLGFVTDDYGLRAPLHAPAPYGRPAYDLFRFASGQLAQNDHAIRAGRLPWWTASDLRIPGLRRGVRIALVGVLAAVHLLLAPLSSWRAIARFAHQARACESIADRLAQVAPPDGRVFLVASDPDVFLYPRGILADTRPGVVRCASILSAAHAAHRITRVDDRTLALEPIDRTLLDGPFETLFRAGDRPFAAGDTVRQCGATMRITDVRAGRPARIEVTFDRTLDAPDLVVLVWRDHQLAPLDALAVGASTDVPWSAGPTGL
jgi:hypothetical protein